MTVKREVNGGKTSVNDSIEILVAPGGQIYEKYAAISGSDMFIAAIDCYFVTARGKSGG
jgi:hypothetical protein